MGIFNKNVVIDLCITFHKINLLGVIFDEGKKVNSMSTKLLKRLFIMANYVSISSIYAKQWYIDLKIYILLLDLVHLV